MGDGLNNSERLRLELAEEDNDLKALGLHSKLIREERNEAWQLKWLPRFKVLLEDNIVFFHEQSLYRIIDKDETFDFYPKANKTFVYSTKKWEKPGLKYLIKRFSLK